MTLDPLAAAYLSRARTAIDSALGDAAATVAPGAETAERAKAFVDIAFQMLRHRHTSQAVDVLRGSNDRLVAKAAAHALGDDIWQNGDAAALAASYIASIAELSLLDQIARYARVLPADAGRVLVASGSSADVASEGDPKVVKRIGLGLAEIEPTKAAAIVVLSNELANAAGGAGRRLFEAELVASITRATNAAVLNRMTDSTTLQVSTTGDPLADLRAGLQMAGPSNGYVVAAPAGVVADLSTRVECKGGMAIRGGTFVPGVDVVAIDDLGSMRVIPASRLALFDRGLEVRSSGDANLNMADSPTAPSQATSLWQTNSFALLAERNFHIVVGDVQVVEVVGSP